MAVTIGIFEQEEKVLDAIRLLREAGAKSAEIRVIVNNREGAPILASDGDVNLEELYEIQESQGYEGDDGLLPLGVAPLATGYPIGNTAMGNGPAGVILAADYDSTDDSSRERVLQDIGVPGNAAERCAKAIESGNYVLVTETDMNAESMLSHAGANIVH